MRRLRNDGWIQRQRVLSRAVPRLHNPIFSWESGNPTPDFRQFSQLLHQRAKQPLVTISVSRATAKCNLLLGCGKHSSVRLTQLTHELQVSEVYLRLRDNLWISELNWLSDDRLPDEWRLSVRPDALLVDSRGNFVRAIEYGGDYSVKRLESLHEAMASILLAYELW